MSSRHLLKSVCAPWKQAVTFTLPLRISSILSLPPSNVLVYTWSALLSGIGYRFRMGGANPSSRDQGFPILLTLRAYGAHKRYIFAVFAGEACKNSKNIQKMACEAGQNAGKRENGKALRGIEGNWTNVKLPCNIRGNHSVLKLVFLILLQYIPSVGYTLSKSSNSRRRQV